MYYAFIEPLNCFDSPSPCPGELWPLKANSLAEAEEEVRDDVLGEWNPDTHRYDDGYWDEDLIESILILCVAHSKDVDVPGWYDAAVQRSQDDGCAPAHIAKLRKQLNVVFGG